MKIKSLTLLAACLGMLAGCASQRTTAQTAVADLKPTQGNQAAGTATFVQKGDKIQVDARMKGLKPGPHGIHVHEKGDCSAPDAMSAGGHFNPASAPHGGPASDKRHAGDLGNLTADASGEAALNLSVPVQSLSMASSGADSLVGRAVVVHANADDFTSQPAGNSGSRIACGIVRLQ